MNINNQLLKKLINLNKKLKSNENWKNVREHSIPAIFPIGQSVGMLTVILHQRHM